jgi:hypothetical protein
MTIERRRPGLRTGLTGTSAIAALLIGGCVGTLETSPYRERTTTLGGALRGVTYSLPKLQYEITLTRSLIECPGETGTDGKPTALKFAIEVAGTAQYVPGEAYTVNYHRLAGLLRTSNFEIKYWPNGTLKSLGAGAEDKTADVVRDVVKTGLSIASVMTGAPTPTPQMQQLMFSEAATRSVPILGCTEDAARLLVEQTRLGKELKASTKALAAYVEQAERILARAAVRLKNEDDRTELIGIFKQVDLEEDKIAAIKERLETIAGELGVIETFVWNSNMKAAADQAWDYKLSPVQQAKLANLLQTIWVEPLGADEEQRRAAAPACYGKAANAAACVAQHLDLRAGLALVSHLPPCDGAGGDPNECIRTAGPTLRRDTAFRDSINRQYRDARDGEADSGIFVREPVRARLVFCRLSRIGAAGQCTGAADEGKMKEEYFPQLGQLRYLPLRVGTFQAREMAIALAEDGRIESFTYKSTKAAAAGFAAMAADAAGQVDAAIERFETERRSDLAYAREREVAGIQAEINRLTKEAELKTLRNPPAPAAPNPLQATLDETTVLLAEIGLLKAKLMKLQAAQALNQAQP